MRDRPQRLGDANRDPKSSRDAELALEQPQLPLIGGVEGRVPQRGAGQVLPHAARAGLLGGRLDRLAPPVGEQQRVTWAGTGARHDRHQQRGRGPERLLLDVAVGRANDALRRAAARDGDRVREVVCGVLHLAVDLRAKLRAAAAVDDDEGHRRADQHHRGHPRCQAPAQTEGGQTIPQRRHAQPASPKR